VALVGDISSTGRLITISPSTCAVGARLVDDDMAFSLASQGARRVDPAAAAEERTRVRPRERTLAA
jgi:hypothetical protein